MDSKDHETALGKMCRVCGGYLGKAGQRTNSYECASHKQQMKDTFDIDVAQDVEHNHPKLLCRGCYDVIRRQKKASKSNMIYKSDRQVFTGWVPHSEIAACSVCDHFTGLSKGGRPKKVKCAGRPTLVGYRSAIRHIEDIAPPTFLPPDTKIDIVHSEETKDLKCHVCSNIVDRPIELSTCGKLICFGCLVNKVDSDSSLVCPLCHDDHLKDFITIRTASSIVLNVLKQLRVNCKLCSSAVKLSTYTPHISSECQKYTKVLVIVDDIMQRPLDSTATIRRTATI